MKLQFLVPQYEEDESIVKPLLDSIAIQQNVDLENDVGVIIVNDGSDVILSQDFLGQYPFHIQYILAPHGGVSAARNVALDAATAEYVVFSDADDILYNACGLWIVFREMKDEGFDGMVSLFVEETRHPVTREVVYINRENDSTFVHGKVWRLQYLREHGLRWNENLTIHEDSYFNLLARNMSDKIKYCTSPWYLWKWRDNSVCRHDPKYMLKTYRDFIKSNDALIDELLRRDKKEVAEEMCAFMLMDSYYTMNKPEWIDQENSEYRDATERAFAAWWRKHKDLWDGMDSRKKMEISNGVRGRVVREGMQMERMTVSDWLAHLEAMA